MIIATFRIDPMGITICMSCNTIVDAIETETGYCVECFAAVAA
jgi:hypothetical protein